MAEDPEQSELAPREGIVSGTAFSLVVQITTTIFTAVLTLYLVRALGPTAFGVFGLALGISTIAILLSDMGVSHSTARFVAERLEQRSAVGAIIADALRLRLLLATIVEIGLVALAEPIADAYGEPDLAWALRGMALAVFFQSVLMLYLDSFTAMGRISRNVWIVLVESLTETTASIALVALGAGAAGATFGRAIGYAVGAAAAVAVATRMIGKTAFRVRRATGRPSHVREIAVYALPLLVTNSAYVLYSTAGILLIGALLTTTDVGIFGAPLRLTVFMGVLGLAVANAVAPRLARHRDDPTSVIALCRALRFLIMFQALLIAPLIVWAEPIVSVLLGPDYSGSVDVLRGLTPYVFLLALGPLITTSVNFLGKAGRRIPIVIGALVVNVGIDVALLREWGIVAAAVGTSVAYLIYVPAHLYLCKQSVTVPLRPLAVTLGRSLLAASVMGGVLALAGTSELSVAAWVAGGSGGVLAYVAALILSGELTTHELRSVVGAVRGRFGAAAAT